MQPVNVILCGAGRMGRHHLRVVQQDEAFRMVAIVDPGLSGGALDGVPVVNDVSEVSAPIDAAIVATPTSTHHDVVIDLLERDIAVLVEKPLAATPAECAAIARSLGGGGRVAIGHIERFNPAVRAISALGAVHHVELVRVGAARRCDVLLELAVHDLDLLERFAGRASLRAADVRSSFGDDIVDFADLALVTETGATATLRAALGERERRIRIECARGTVELDLLAQSATVNGIALSVAREEPLRAQLTGFRAFLDGLPSDVCLIDEAARSVELADAARRARASRFAEAAP
jgi:UDP-N-acetylglucosamine 3-dehydrogenase